MKVRKDTDLLKFGRGRAKCEINFSYASEELKGLCPLNKESSKNFKPYNK